MSSAFASNQCFMPAWLRVPAFGCCSPNQCCNPRVPRHKGARSPNCLCVKCKPCNPQNWCAPIKGVERVRKHHRRHGDKVKKQSLSRSITPSSQVEPSDFEGQQVSQVVEQSSSHHQSVEEHEYHTSHKSNSHHHHTEHSSSKKSGKLSRSVTRSSQVEDTIVK